MGGFRPAPATGVRAAYCAARARYTASTTARLPCIGHYRDQLSRPGHDIGIHRNTPICSDLSRCRSHSATIRAWPSRRSDVIARASAKACVIRDPGQRRVLPQERDGDRLVHLWAGADDGDFVALAMSGQTPPIPDDL